MVSATGFEEICLSHDKVPQQIAVPPDIDLSYDDLNKETLLGMGGFAQVHRASVLGGELDVVALKEPRLGGTNDNRVSEMFANEAELWSHLKHDFITKVLDWGTEPHPWIALEYANGGTLADHIQRQNLEQSLWVAVCIAKAVKYAHSRGVVHLDLKPQNILFSESRDGEWAVPKVTDWGLAKLLLKSTGEIEGLSFHYAAPEQLRPEEYDGPDEKTDVYQLGGVVYALLTGQPPVTGSKQEMVDMTLSGNIDPPSSVNTSLPRSLDPPIMQALQTDPVDRYEDVLLLRRALERAFLDVHSIENCPQPRVDRRRTGRIGATGPTSAVGIGWKSGGSFIPDGPPAVVDDLGYLTTRQGTLHVFSVHSGAVHRTVELTDGPLTPPVIQNDRIYVADQTGMVHSIAQNEDRRSWKTKVGLSIRAAPLVHNDRIIVTTHDGVVLSLDPPDTLVWETQVQGNVSAHSTIWGDQVFVPTADGVYALDLDSGRLNWDHRDDAPFSSSLAAVGGSVYAAGRNTITALDTETGDPLWRYATDKDPTGLAATQPTCYVSTDGGELLALDASTGSMTWSYVSGHLELTAPILGHELAFVGCSAPGRKSLPTRMDDVWAVDLETGSVRWTYATDAEVEQPPVITGDSLLVADTEGGLYSLE